MTIEYLVGFLIRYAGTDEENAVDMSGDPNDLLDVPLPDLGYDSLGVLNTLAEIEKEYSLNLDDDTFTDPKMTLREMLGKINEALRARESRSTGPAGGRTGT